MKKLLLLLSVFFVSSVSANLWSETKYDFLEIYERDGRICFHITTETRHAMCPLMIQRLEVKLPTDNENGLIDMDVDTDPKGICLFAFGPHSGRFYFERGSSLPRLSVGIYDIVLNGTDRGRIFIHQEGFELLPGSRS